MKNQSLKAAFGLVIFLFSLALAYFTANYMSDNHIFDYWGTLAIFAGAYVLVGIAVSMIFSISLGFLFAADALILSLLSHYYGHWDAIIKLTTIGAILIVIYACAARAFREESGTQAPSTNFNLPHL